MKAPSGRELSPKVTEGEWEVTSDLKQLDDLDRRAALKFPYLSERKESAARGRYPNPCPPGAVGF